MNKFIDILNDIFKDAFEELGYNNKYGQINLSNRPDLCQFQCNGALPASKEYKKNPKIIAEEILSKVKNHEIFSEVTIAGPGFINITIKDEFISDYLNKMCMHDKLGVVEEICPKTIIVDYGGANIAKPLHVGHLRAAIIGESIKKMARFLGHKVIGDVHLGDWGLQIGMVIAGVKRRNPELPYFDENFQGQYPKEAPFTIDELEEIYPSESKIAKNDEKEMEKAKQITVELQQGRKGYLALWKHILNVSVKDLKKNYGTLNVEFDLWNGESDCEKYIPVMINYLKDNGYAYISEGALVVDVKEDSDKQPMPPIIIQKSDGASLYGTTDLATIWERVKSYSPNEIIYVVDKRQGLHFEQVFRCAQKCNIVDGNVKLEFIGFGTMNGKDGKPFKTRDGGVMRLNDLIALIKDSVKEKMKNNDEISLTEKEEMSRIIAVAALKYGDLSNILTKDYIFDLDKFTSFDGNTGPYILYTVVRIKSILRKADYLYENSCIVTPNSGVERDLMLKLCKFNEVIYQSFEENSPNKICEYMYDISNIFNKFYNENKIIAEESICLKNSWLNLIYLASRVIDSCLGLLGIDTLERM